MSVQGHGKICKLLKEEQLKDRLIISPLLNPEQVGEASVDIRLGNNFIVTRRGNLGHIDPAQDKIKGTRYQSKHHVNHREPFYLHPNELVLAGTLEYFRLPCNIAGYVTSRSSWGRVGLVIATATAVHPGFTGVITLELVNHGEVPLALYFGLRIAQLVLYDCQEADSYDGRFGLQTDARFGEVHKGDPSDLSFWIPQK